MFDRGIFIRHVRFSEAEFTALQAVRRKHLATCTQFTERELANLQFMRWLIRRPEWDAALDRPVRPVVMT